MSHFTGFSHALESYVAAADRWPSLPSRVIRVGGVAVTCAQAAAAYRVLAAAGGVAVRQVLAASGSPLAACDYHAAAAPYAADWFAADGWGRGAAGRPRAKAAFLSALGAALGAAAAAEPARVFAAELAAARSAFGADHGYAAQMAAAAVALRRTGRAVSGRDAACASERAA